MQPATDARFRRSPDRILGGVCSGIAERFHIDPLLVRIAFVLGAFGQGLGILLYLVLWLVMPERVEGQVSWRSGIEPVTADLRRIWAEVAGRFGRPPDTTKVPPTATREPSPPSASGAAPAPPHVAAPPPPLVAVPDAGQGDHSVLLGVLLVVLGVVFLGTNTGLVKWNVSWPAALIAVGIVLLLRNAQRKP